ncbi:MAG: hypothetical protein CMJ18_05725 [Phycisphaeraceae bacterium]|nr:hypothetical protein [Phycisphaeraceae bacterium]
MAKMRPDSNMTTRKWLRHDDLAINPRCEVGREAFLDHMTFRRNDRPLFTEIFGPLVGLKEEWEQQGATPQELDFSAFRYRRPAFGTVPINAGWHGGEPDRVLEETDAMLTFRDAMGRTMRLPKGVATMPLPLDYPVRTMDDWRRTRCHHEFSEHRLAPGWEEVARRIRDADQVVCISIPGGFDTPRQLLGDAAACEAFYADAELIHDILRVIGDTTIAVLDRVTRAVQIDMIRVHEDMAGRNGPLIGPAHVRQFIAPYYRRVADLALDRGIRLFDQDSDGDMNPVIEAFVDAGINCMHPIEPTSNMNIVELRKKYGTRLAFYGGIDKHVLRQGRDDIDAELETKIPTMVRSGGCMLGLDHRIPNGTPLVNYRYYIEKAWQILDRETTGLG